MTHCKTIGLTSFNLPTCLFLPFSIQKKSFTISPKLCFIISSFLYAKSIAQPSNHMAFISDIATTPSAAHKVFQITELLEQILGDVRLCDLFRAAAVCTRWNIIFENSPALQKKAYLIPDPYASDYEDLFDDELGLVVNAHSPSLAEDGILYFELFFSFESGNHELIRLTANLRRCLATQPPCKKMRVTPWCCSENISDQEVIRHDPGITLGDMVDVARRIDAEHQNCPDMMRKIRQGTDSMAIYLDMRGLKARLSCLMTIRSDWRRLNGSGGCKRQVKVGSQHTSRLAWVISGTRIIRREGMLRRPMKIHRDGQYF